MHQSVVHAQQPTERTGNARDIADGESAVVVQLLDTEEHAALQHQVGRRRGGADNLHDVQLV
jgi:hypothetical protein